MRIEDAIGYLKKAKALGFAEREIGIPLPEEKAGEAAVPAQENFENFLEESGEESFHCSLLLSEFPYSVKGTIAFSTLSAEIAEGMPAYEEGAYAKMRYFAKTGKKGLGGEIEKAGSEEGIAKLMSGLPAKTKEARFAVHSDGKLVRCFVRIGSGWKKISSMPFSEGVWPVQGGKFLAAYAAGSGIYGNREFNPALGNALFAATSEGEYGWVERKVGTKKIERAADEAAGIYSEMFGLEETVQLRDFTVLSALLKDAQFAEANGKIMHAPEFFVNVQYMLARAESEKKAGNGAEATFLLRAASDISMLALRAVPLGGRMLALAKYFDACENAAGEIFAVDEGLAAALEKNGVVRKKGEARMPFSNLLGQICDASFFSKRNDNAGFWRELKSENAALLLATYGHGHAISLLGEDAAVARGSDVYKIELFGSKLVVKRAMVLETGNAKEIKAHLSRIISVADKRAVDEKYAIEEMGSFGEAVYEIVRRKEGNAIALVSSKRFY